MTLRLPILLSMSAVCVAACDNEGRQKAAQERALAAEQKNLEDRARSILGEVMFDPTAILVKDVKRGSDEGGKLVVCGKVNGKNKFGGYVGFRPFVARTTQEGRSEVFTDSTEGDPAPTAEQMGEAFLYREAFAKYCQRSPVRSRSTRNMSGKPGKTKVADLQKGEMAEPLPRIPPSQVRVVLEGGSSDPCSNGVVKGLKVNGDGFLSVRARPEVGAAELFKLHNGDQVYVCDVRQNWFGIIEPAHDGDDCGGPMEAQSRARPYAGKCRSGWADKRWIEIWAG